MTKTFWRVFFQLTLLNSKAFAVSWSFDVFSRELLAGPCTSQASVKDENISQLWIDADKLKEHRQYCESAEYYLKIMQETLDASERSRAWYERIESFFFQYDYENFFAEALGYYQERKNTALWEQVHFLIMKGIHELSLNPKSMANPWLQYGLGVHPEQLSSETTKTIYSYQSFIEAFPKSENAIFVRSFLDEARVDFDENYLKETRELAMHREYAPAIARYQFLLKQGPEFEGFPVALYELVQVMMDFSLAILDSNAVSIEKLERWLLTSKEQITVKKRQQVANMLQAEAKKIVKMMATKLPENPWTQKACHEFGFKSNICVLAK